MDDPFDAALADLQRFIAIDIDGDGKPDAMVPREYGIAPPAPSLQPTPGRGEVLRSGNTPMGDAVAQRLGPAVGPYVSGAERAAAGVVNSTGVPALTNPESTPGQMVRGAADLVGSVTPVGNALAAYDAGSAALEAGKQGNWGNALVNTGLGVAALGGGYALKRALGGRNALAPQQSPIGPTPDARIQREMAEAQQGQLIADRYQTPVPLNSLYGEARPSAGPNLLASPAALEARGPGPRVGGFDDPKYDWIGKRDRPLRTDAMLHSVSDVDQAHLRQVSEAQRVYRMQRPQTDADIRRMLGPERRPVPDVEQVIDADIAQTVNGLRGQQQPGKMGGGAPTVEMIQEIAARHQIPVDEVVERLRRQGFEFGSSKRPYTGRDERGKVQGLDWNTVNALTRRPSATPFE